MRLASGTCAVVSFKRHTDAHDGISVPAFCTDEGAELREIKKCADAAFLNSLFISWRRPEVVARSSAAGRLTSKRRAFLTRGLDEHPRGKTRPE